MELNTKISKFKDFFSKNKKSIIITSSIVISVLFLFSIIFSLVNINNTKIISKVKINGIEVGKLSKEEASKKINETINQKLEGDILVKSDGFEYGIKLSQIETKYDTEKAVQEAYEFGRSGNIFSNNFQIMKAMILGKEISLNYEYNEELLENILNDMTAKVPDAVVQPNYSIEDDLLIITRGKEGNGVDKEKLKQEIIDKILDNNFNIEIKIDLIKTKPEDIDIDKIYEEVHTEAKDAYYTKDPFQVFPHVNGIDFDLEAARELLKEDKEEYEIQLIITIPKITTDKIGNEAFPDLLATFSTKYDASNAPRTTNLKLAMSRLNGVVVPAGEVFSYNKTLGKRTAEAGYKEAGGFEGGRVVQTLAGGICQISSTLYDAVVYANLDVVERHSHMFLAGYVAAGKDATVVYGSLDFKFKNTRKYPIMIKTSIGGGVATISIYGIKEEVEYDVDIVTNVLSYTPFKVIYENDSSLGAGQERVAQKGMNGCKSITYKILKLNGVEVSRKVLSSDSYDPMNKIIKVGGGSTSSSSTETYTEPDPTPEPSSVQEPQPSSSGTGNSQPSTTPSTPTTGSGGGEGTGSSGGEGESNLEP